MESLSRSTFFGIVGFLPLGLTRRHILELGKLE